MNTNIKRILSVNIHLPLTKWTSGAHISDLAQSGQDLLGKTSPMGLQLTRSRENMRGKVSGELPELRTPR